MGAALLITLREGLEAGLVVSIVLAYLRQIGRRDAFRQVWLGIFAAFGLASAFGVAAYLVVGGLEGDARRIVFGAVSLAAATMLTWMLFWMRTQARTMSRHLREQVDAALRSESLWGVASVVFLAVVRDSIETVLFMLAILFGTSPLGWAVGAALGLAGAVALSFVIYQGGRRINLGLFFSVTGGMVLIIAAGLAAKGVAWLQEAGVVPTFLWPVWNLRQTALVGHGAVAQFLNGLFGWNPQPSIEEVVVWVAYLAVFGYLFFLAGRPSKPAPRRVEQPAARQA